MYESGYNSFPTFVDLRWPPWLGLHCGTVFQKDEMFITTCVWCPDSNFDHFATVQLNTYFSLDINGFISELVAGTRVGNSKGNKKLKNCCIREHAALWISFNYIIEWVNVKVLISKVLDGSFFSLIGIRYIWRYIYM